jgi:hypothetical protein
MICFRLLHEHDPEGPLQEAIHAVTIGRSPGNVFEVDPSLFRKIPNAPFAYWVSNDIKHLFDRFEPFEGENRQVRPGLCSGNDFRFLRLGWEVELSKMNDQWYPFAKGGTHSPVYADVYLVVNWRNHGEELIAGANTGTIPGARPQNIRFYCRAGFFQTLRAASLAPHYTPPGCLFGHNGFQGFSDTSSLFSLLAIVNSHACEYLLKTQLGRYGYSLFVPGTLQATPIPEISEASQKALGDLALAWWKNHQAVDATNLTSHAFVSPTSGRSKISLSHAHESLVQQLHHANAEVAEFRSKINAIAYDLYEITEQDRCLIERMLGDPDLTDEASETDEEDAGPNLDARSVSFDLLEYLQGCSFGRWDIRYANGERQPPKLPDPFDPLPVCPPGMLQNAEGLPAEPKDVPADYPLRISWTGILVDDENHPEDIVARVREAIEVIWKDRAEAIEQEANEVLGVKTLRDYFRRPSAFFADHLKRYSKSRRQAPIYWPLSTKSGSYTLWLYYHRLTDQTLHTCLADFLDPKIKKVQSELDGLVASGKDSTRAGELREFLDELKDLHDEIERVIKLPWRPNLNDGVLITASPLHKLFRLPKWQKDLKACWDKLVKGDYDWAHLAYTIWPTRVEKACQTDRSIAIAHGREDLCKVEAPKAKKKRAKKKGAEVDEVLELNEED